METQYKLTVHAGSMSWMLLSAAPLVRKHFTKINKPKRKCFQPEHVPDLSPRHICVPWLLLPRRKAPAPSVNGTVWAPGQVWAQQRRIQKSWPTNGSKGSCFDGVKAVGV